MTAPPDQPVIELAWSNGQAFAAGTRVRVRRTQDHGTVRTVSGYFHAVDLDGGETIIALGGALEAARPHSGWKPRLVTKEKP